MLQTGLRCVIKVLEQRPKMLEVSRNEFRSIDIDTVSSKKIRLTNEHKYG